MVHWFSNGVYLLTANEEYSVTQSYNALIGRHERMQEADLVWNSIMMPRHRFIVWLAYQNRLLTKERLQRLNMLAGDEKCNLCVNDQVETQQYLFADCTWTRGVQQALARWSGISFQRQTVKQTLQWLKRRNWKKFHKEVETAIFGALIYHTWKARNWKILRNLIIQAEEVGNQIQKEVKERIESQMSTLQN
ncbi:hypothetical protein MTR67_002212 [Solanum verrucosum]|uniref:Reverse transcriptase zinc-binding domain-containing protein n=1 Tax=Solanum verrucosum TaxID=315347 RepID=A0AAF0T5P6_SOLVR|nr:hypothetical protein MTR67_002212 [Solanum verrucosum]